MKPGQIPKGIFKHKRLYEYAKTVTKRLESEQQEKIAGGQIQKLFVRLSVDGMGRRLSTCSIMSDQVEIFGYYKAARVLSGSFFDVLNLDTKHYVFIKCDAAGTGAPAALITILVATIFVTYFRGWTIKNPGLNIDRLLYTINDMLEERGFYGRFAALIIGIIDVESGRSVFCNAGDNIIHVYKKRRGKMIKVNLSETSAAGVFI